MIYQVKFADEQWSEEATEIEATSPKQAARRFVRGKQNNIFVDLMRDEGEVDVLVRGKRDWLLYRVGWKMTWNIRAGDAGGGA